MLKTMLHTIHNHNLISKGDRIVIGLSGGPDSLALTHALSQLIKSHEIELYAVHINHMFRGEEADADESFVEKFCESVMIKCFSYKIDVTAFANKNSMSFEEAGRVVRYEKFEEIKALVGANKIAVAQNKNDTVETFMINLFRGAGIDGLASIEYIRDEVYIRPLLDVSREKIEEYCTGNNLIPRRDHTNDENDYVRNKIRNVMLPYIKENFNEGIVETISKTVHIMKTEKNFWIKHTELLFENCCFEEINQIKIDLSNFENLHEAEKSQLIRYCIKKIRGNLTNLSSEKFRQIIELSNTGTHIDIDTNFEVLREYNNLYIQNKLMSNTSQLKEFPQLKTKIIRTSEKTYYAFSNDVVGIDSESVTGELRVRTRHDGDRFIPLGMQGHKKLKDFFIDEKVPRNVRDRLLIVHDDEKIVWIEGMRIHEYCKITKNTKNITIISFEDIVQTN